MRTYLLIASLFFLTGIFIHTTGCAKNRSYDENDLRAYRVYLTEKGKEMRGIILGKLTSFIDILFSDFTLEEKENFRLLIHKASIKLFEPGLELPSHMPDNRK